MERSAPAALIFLSVLLSPLLLAAAQVKMVLDEIAQGYAYGVVPYRFDLTESSPFLEPAGALYRDAAERFRSLGFPVSPPDRK